MAKIVRLTESDLTRLIKRVIKEQKKSRFMTFLDNNREIRGTGAVIVAIERCLKKNGFSNPDSAPEEFKSIVIKTDAFGYGNRHMGDFSNTTDVRTKKLLNCMKQNDYQGYFEK